MGNTACWPSVIKKDNARRQERGELVERQQQLRDSLTALIATSSRSASEHLARAQVSRASRNTNSNKQSALAHMRLYKIEMNNHDSVCKQRATVDHTIRNLQKTEINHMIATNAKAVSKFTTRYNADIGDVAAVMDDLAEGMAEAQENEEALGQPINDTSVEIDDDELMNELDNMQSDDTEEMLSTVSVPERALEPTSQAKSFLQHATQPRTLDPAKATQQTKYHHPVHGRVDTRYTQIVCSDDDDDGKLDTSSVQGGGGGSTIGNAESFLMQM
jgi:hypothetical protein